MLELLASALVPALDNAVADIVEPAVVVEGRPWRGVALGLLAAAIDTAVQGQAAVALELAADITAGSALELGVLVQRTAAVSDLRGLSG